MTRRNNRLGFTLLELMVIMSVTGVFMLLATAWIGETMRFSARIRSHQRQHSQLTRLGWNFRTDVRQSHSMTCEDDRRLVLLQGNGQQVVYTISGTTIEVEKLIGSQVRRDKFPLAPNSLVEWDIGGLPESIGLIVSRSRDPEIASTKKQGGSGGVNRNTISPVDPELMPIDVHIFAHINRWPVQYGSDEIDRGAQ